MGKIGNKSASFINHKHFHPGNRENLEKVWLAEEKHKAELKRQKEMREKLAEEIRITELKRQLREQEDQKYKQYLLEQKPVSKYEVSQSSHLINNTASGLILTKAATETASKANASEKQKIVIRSRYREDVFEHGHSTVFGSYYDRASRKWGYKCCKTIDKGAKCTEGTSKQKASETDRPSGKRTIEEDAAVSQEKPHKHKKKVEFSLAETIEKLKKMEALD